MHDDVAVLKETREAFANIRGTGLWPVESLESIEAYFICLNGEYGIIVPLQNLPSVDETFSNVRFAVRDFSIDRKEGSKTCLSLTSPMSQTQYGDKFVLLCYDFLLWVSSSEDVRNNPFKWWEDWKRMVGNAERERSAYPTIAEMIALDIMLTAGYDPTWEGPSKGTVDIRSDVYDCEVKSSLNRYEPTVHISSQSQLRKTGRDLHLCYICFEQSDSGLCIDDMVGRLTEHGMNEAEIEDNLQHIGFQKGNHSRTVKYSPLKIWDFTVDDDFPYIDENSFVGGRLPFAVEKFEYTILLPELEPKPLDYPFR